MDCKTAHLLLDFARPLVTELEPGETEALENHLIDCPACAHLARDERRLDAHVGQALRDVPIPAGLRERLLNQVASQVRHDSRRRVVRAAVSLAAAAALLGVAWLGLAWFARPTTIDVQQLLDDNVVQFNRPRETLDDWLAAQNVHVPPPESFDYQLLRSYQMANVPCLSPWPAAEGRRVPLLLFTCVKDQRVYQARVYLLDGREFNLAALAPDSYENHASPFTATLISNVNPRFAYLVIFNADSLEPFQAPGRSELSASQS